MFEIVIITVPNGKHKTEHRFYTMFGFELQKVGCMACRYVREIYGRIPQGSYFSVKSVVKGYK